MCEHGDDREWVTMLQVDGEQKQMKFLPAEFLFILRNAGYLKGRGILGMVHEVLVITIAIIGF